jgi:hypothetical protein
MSEIISKIKKWFGRIRFKKITYIKKGIRPKHDWYIILVITFLLVCVSVGLAYYFYIQIDQGKLFPASDKTSIKSVVIDNVLLNKVIMEIDEREKNLNDFKENKVIPEDPSI